MENVHPFLETVVESLAVGVCVWQLERPSEPLSLVLKVCNSAAARFLSVKRSDVLGKYIEEGFPGATQTPLPGVFMKAISEGKSISLGDIPYSDEIVPDGVFSISVYPIEQSCVVVEFTNVTDERRAQSDSKSMLAAANAAREEARCLNTEVQEKSILLEHQLRVASELSESAGRAQDFALLGESLTVAALRQGIDLHAQRENPLLLTGPAGAGQEAVARAIHRASRRGKRPFIFVDCGFIEKDDGVSIFGESLSEKEAFGKAALADGGTLYLARVESLSLEAQLRLLNYMRISQKNRRDGTPTSPDIRVITASTRDLLEDAQCGRFNPALERILAASKLHLPSLAERCEDISCIAGHLVRRRARALGKVIDRIDDTSLSRLNTYRWPGNLRELEIVLDRAVLVSKGSTLYINEDMLSEGVRVGGYQLARMLGEGGMGEVWQAKHNLLARPAAVKLIRDAVTRVDSIKRKTIERRFRREAEVTAKLRSPHTVELYDFGITEKGALYYVMEYLVGIDLQAMLDHHGPLPVERVIAALSQACLSLGEAHQLGLVHRDIKPSNLFLCNLGPHYDFLKVLDFGIVKTLKADETQVTAQGALPGTPLFLSPEIIGGLDVDGAADIYALGCVLFTLLTGEPVFVASSTMALLIKHVSADPRLPTQVNPNLPKEVDEIVVRCLDKNPERRPDAFELRRMLADVPLTQVWTEEKAVQWWRDVAATKTDRVDTRASTVFHAESVK